MGWFKESVRTILRSVFDIEVRRFKSISIPAKHMVASLRNFDIDLVLDVGANTGQFSSELRQWGYTGRIVSFEPLSQAHAELLRVCAGDPMWEAYPRCALGDHDGEIEINLAGNSESSSILPMLEAHRSAAPQSAYVGKEIVPIKTLDDVARQYIKKANAPFLKIDTQGFEWQVLDGARDILPNIKGIMVELSLVPLYEGQRLWRDVIDRLEAEGFMLWYFKPAFFDEVSGRTLQVDAIFYRTA